MQDGRAQRDEILHLLASRSIADSEEKKKKNKSRKKRPPPRRATLPCFLNAHLFLDAAQEKSRAETGEHGAGQKENEIRNDGRNAGLAQAHEAKGMAEMGEREGLRDQLDAGRKLLERGKGSR